jgi:hypothetical protein
LFKVSIKGQYRTEVVAVEALMPSTIAAMAQLYLQNFDATSQELFREDLTDKDEVLLLFCDEELAGFTTLKVLVRTWNGTEIRLVFSGDTIVSPAHWGQQQLAFAWITRIGEIKRQVPASPLYWFLLVKGHRTFKYLSVFGKSFFPHWTLDRGDLKPLADMLALERFGADYNPATGVVEFSKSRGHLKSGIASATPEELQKPATQFFFKQNRDYRQGHELVCICELESFNMKPLAARVYSKAVDASAIA